MLVRIAPLADQAHTTQGYMFLIVAGLDTRMKTRTRPASVDDIWIPIVLAFIVFLAVIGLISSLIFNAIDREFVKDQCVETDYYAHVKKRVYPVYLCKEEGA